MRGRIPKNFARTKAQWTMSHKGTESLKGDLGWDGALLARWWGTSTSPNGRCCSRSCASGTLRKAGGPGSAQGRSCCPAFSSMNISLWQAGPCTIYLRNLSTMKKCFCFFVLEIDNPDEQHNLGDCVHSPFFFFSYTET